MLRPEEIDLIPVKRCIHRGFGQAMAPTQGNEELLQVRSGAVGGSVAAHRQTKELRLPDRSGELGRGKEATKVGQGAGRCGHRDTPAACAGRGNQGGGAVERDSGASCSSGRACDRDVDRFVSWVPDSPKGRCAPVTKDGAFAMSEDGGHPPAVIAEAAVADGVNTMNAVQASGGDPAGNTCR